MLINDRFLAELDAVRRLAGRFPRWRSVDSRLHIAGVPPSLVATFVDPEAAHYIARLHALILPVSNTMIELKNRLEDHITMTKEIIRGKA